MSKLLMNCQSILQHLLHLVTPWVLLKLKYFDRNPLLLAKESLIQFLKKFTKMEQSVLVKETFVENEVIHIYKFWKKENYNYENIYIDK